MPLASNEGRIAEDAVQSQHSGETGLSIAAPRGRRKRTLLYASLVVIGLTASLLMPIPFRGRVSAAFGNMVHAPLFAVMTILSVYFLTSWFSGRRSNPSTKSGLRQITGFCFVAAGGLFLFGVAIEFLQDLSGRSSSLRDVLSNGLGIFAGCLLVIANRLRKEASTEHRNLRLLWVIAGFLIAVVWWEPVATIRDVQAMFRDFPLLASFESKTELERWYFNRVTARLTRGGVTQGNRSLEVTFPTIEHSAATMIDLKHDWSNVKTIEMDVVLDPKHRDPTAELWINVIDRSKADDYHDIFRKRFTIKRGEPEHLVISRQELEQPNAGRKLDLKHIQFIEIQMLSPPVVTKVNVDFLRLRL